MDTRELDFEGLARHLLGKARNLLPLWLPGGALRGAEWCCGDLRGERGDSLKVNVNTGKWADFATGDKGGDLVSLYAAIHGIKQAEAAKRLAESENYSIRPQETNSVARREEPKPSKPDPKHLHNTADFRHGQHGDPSTMWEYKDSDGSLMFFVARYDTSAGKQILPWSWVDGRWQCKGWPAPRPLYGLQELAANPAKPVLIVEGEKAADAARKIVGSVYVVVTWPNGSKAVSKADWRPVYGRKVLIWPDADEAGISAGYDVAKILTQHVPEVKLIDPSVNPSLSATSGWDAADALAAGWTWNDFKEWAKTRVSVYKTPDLIQATAVAETDKTIAAAQVNVQLHTEDGVDIPGNLQEIYASLGIMSTRQGAAVCNLNNINRALSGLDRFKGSIWFDDFHRKFFTTLDSTEPHEWLDIDDLRLTNYLQERLGFLKVSDDLVNKAVRLFAKSDIRNEPRDWFETLVWDKKPRIESFFIDCAEAPDNDYVRAASRNFWVSMVARVYKPGSKVDNMVILEGGQGKFKSTLLATIGGKWHSESSEAIGTSNFYQSLNGKLIIEFADLSNWPKYDVDVLKKTITCRVDRYRAPYARNSEDFPRTSIFAGTTNESIYLRDDTGARRFWPIQTGFIDIARTSELREQLFAEAVEAFKAGASWWEMPDSALNEQELRRISDEWEHVIADFLIQREEITIKEIALDSPLKIDLAKLDKSIQMRIARIIKSLGWERRTVRTGGNIQKMWFRNRNHGGGNDEVPW